MEELFVQIESGVTNKILVFVLDILNTFSSTGETDVMTSPESFQESLARTRKDECPLTDASQGVTVDESRIKVNKVSFGVIHVASIKIGLTFKLE